MVSERVEVLMENKVLTAKGPSSHPQTLLHVGHFAGCDVKA
jgi:hypothetical protein